MQVFETAVIERADELLDRARRAGYRPADPVAEATIDLVYALRAVRTTPGLTELQRAVMIGPALSMLDAAIDQAAEVPAEPERQSTADIVLISDRTRGDIA